MVADPFTIAAACDPFRVADTISKFRAAGVGTGYGGGGFTNWAGSKFPTGWGATHDLVPDYWELRRRSAQLFTENLYARGLIRRLVTNEIVTGLVPESEPNSALLPGLTEDSAEVWAEDVENRWEIYTKAPHLCDYEARRTFAQLQREARREALIEGDILIVLRMDRRLRLPQIQLIRGGRVRTPLDQMANRKVVHGVDHDDRGRQIGYYVRQDDGSSVRIPAFGQRSGKRMAWLYYATDKRMDQARGTPLLSLVLQSLREMDRNRDSEQRAAVINSMVAMFIRKETEKMGTLPISGGAVRNQRLTGTGLDNEPREFNLAEQWPGLVFEELQQGEVPESFDTKRPSVNFAAFEAAIINAIAWANEVPPEILTLAFQNNYSASKAAINEFKTYLTLFRSDFGEGFCQPIYVEWLVSEVLLGSITANGFLEAWRDPNQFATFGAWTTTSWGGPVKPSVELSKDVRAYTEAIEANMCTLDRASKDLFGVRFSKVAKRRAKELKTLATMRADAGVEEVPPVVEEPLTNARVMELVRDEIEEITADA